jgi:hypothetical protein
MGMLKRYIEIGNKNIRVTTIGHDPNHLVHMRVGIHIMEPDPAAVLGGNPPECFSEIRETGSGWSTVQKLGSIMNIDTIG